jgi:hypothetical protein
MVAARDIPRRVKPGFQDLFLGANVALVRF